MINDQSLKLILPIDIIFCETFMRLPFEFWIFHCNHEIKCEIFSICSIVKVFNLVTFIFYGWINVIIDKLMYYSNENMRKHNLDSIIWYGAFHRIVC